MQIKDQYKIILVLGLIFSFLLAVFVMTIVVAKPVADDYSFFSVHYARSPLKALLAFRFDGGARYAQAFVQAIWFGLFGAKAVNLYPFWLLAVATLSVYWIMSSFNSLNKALDNRLSRITRLLGSSIIAILMFFIIPSFIDNILWFSSATVHVSGIVWSIFAIALVLDLHVSVKSLNKMSRKNRKRFLIKYIPLSLLAMFHLTHSEVANIAVGSLAAVSILIIFIKLLFEKSRKGIIERVKTSVIPSWIFLGLLAAIPLLIIYFSPAIAIRMAAVQQGGIVESVGLKDILVGAFRWSVFLRDRTYFNLLVMVASLLSATIVFVSFDKKIIKKLEDRAKLSDILLVGLLGGVSFYATVCADFIAVRGVNLRMMALPAVVAFLTWLFVWLILLVIGSRKLKSEAWFVLLCAISLLTIIVLLPKHYPVAKAVYRRQQLFNAREVAINSYKSGKMDKLGLFPVLYLHESDAQDIFYNGGQYDWIIPSIYNYYALNQQDPNVYISTAPQPFAYCDSNFTSEESGIKNCEYLFTN